MRLLLTTLLLVSFALASEAAPEKHESRRSTIYMERIVRDTVFVTLEPEVDTVHVEVKNIKYSHEDSVYTHHLFYLQFDLFSGFYSIFESTSVVAGLEVSFSPKNSLLLNYHYAKKEPEEESSNVFDAKNYTGYILQHDIGIGYRHYFQLTRFSPYFELGANYLMRKAHYDNIEKNPGKHPETDHETFRGYQPYLHFGMARRDKNWAFGVAGGFAYNIVPSFDDDILEGHFMHITSGLQLDLRINFSMGVL